jgi:hypothetical protein
VGIVEIAADESPFPYIAAERLPGNPERDKRPPRPGRRPWTSRRSLEGAFGSARGRGMGDAMHPSAAPAPARQDRPAVLDLRFGPGEWLGALGDTGTLIPILLSVSVLNGIDLNRSLLLCGIVYAATALRFRLPVPVQPLKAMAAVALARGLDSSVIEAGALLMGVAFTLFGCFGAIPRLARFFPRPVVRGLQGGVGAMLGIAAIRLLRPTVLGPTGASVAPAPALELQDFVSAFFLLVVPQLPLTLGNAVFATADALRAYYGERAQRAAPAALAGSIGLANLAAFALGAYPLCHGSGGVTAHFRFGARTGGATLLLGVGLAALSLLAPWASFDLLGRIPLPLLGLSLLYVAARHLQLAARWEAPGEAVTIAAMTTVAALTANLAAALAAGWLLLLAGQLGKRVAAR